MTDLLIKSRPGMEPTTGDKPRNPVFTCVLAAMACAGSGLVVWMALALAGWFFADAGAHGETTAALAFGVVGWLVGHGVSIQLADTSISLLPLGVWLLLAVCTYRFARWAGELTAVTQQPGSEPVPSGDRSLIFQEPRRVAEKALVRAILSFGITYVAIGLGSALLVSPRTARFSLWEVGLTTALMAFGVGGLGLAIGMGLGSSWWKQTPGFVKVIMRGSALAALLLFSSGALLAASNLLFNFNQIASVISGLGLTGGDLFMFALLNLSLAPNAVAYAMSYLAGPGFAVGTHTSVSITQVELGAVPALPWFAALPNTGVPPAILMMVLALPVLSGLIAAILAQRIYAVPALDSAALRGFGVGFGGSVLVALLCWMASGSLGDGRMAQIGPNGWAVLLSAGAAMSLGGLVGGLATAWWQQRRGMP
ncbi:MAG TPA: DUF6350 family protein [Marmoricola sp.]|nr:DUF6350 family protein [Marmoricola sp.]